MAATVVSQDVGRIAQVIFQHAAKISKEREISSIIRLNSDLARDLVGAERCSVWLKDQDKNELWTRVAHGIDDIRIPARQGIVGACVAEQRPLLVNDVQSDPRFFQNVDASSGFRTRSLLCVPLRVDDNVIGALQLVNKDGGFLEEDTELLKFMALYAANAIQAERLRTEAEAARLFRHDLDIARDVQSGLFPRDVQGPDLECAGLCRQAKMIGGDYYDLLELQQGRFALTLGDVSGKSVAAAVLMASIHTLLRSFLMRSSGRLAEVITELNKAVYANSTPERYSTLFCGVLSADRRSLAFVNAGHVPPILIRADGRIERPSENDLPVGLLPMAKFQQHELLLEPGDLVVAVSDGVMEAENNAHESPDPLLIDSVLVDLRHKPVREIGAALIEAVDGFCEGAEQFDDMTVVVLRVR